MKLFNNKSTVLILTHHSIRTEEGEHMDQRIIRYLKTKIKRIILITHPLPQYGNPYSFCTIYENNKKIKELKAPSLIGPELVQYFIHIFLLYYFLFRTGFSFELCIAMDNLSFVSIWPIRLVGSIKKLVYYSLDLVPSRFSNPVLNNIYHFIDKLSCKYSDINWVVSEQQIISRKAFGISRSNSSPFFVVPTGHDLKDINIRPFEKIDFYNLVFAGGLREATGVQLILETMPLLIKRFPKIKLTVMGTGPYSEQLKKISRDSKIEKWVEFLGYVDSFKDLSNKIARGSIGLAPYAPISGSFAFYSDTSKIKMYICCGLPVISTKVSTLASLVSKTHSGVVIDYSKDSLYKAVVHLLSNEKRYKSYKNDAIKSSIKFDVNNILDVAFKKIPG